MAKPVITPHRATGQMMSPSNKRAVRMPWPQSISVPATWPSLIGMPVFLLVSVYSTRTPRRFTALVAARIT